MKKGLLVVSITAVVIAVLGLAGYAAAQVRSEYLQRLPRMAGPGMMDGRREFGPGMMDDQRGLGRGGGMMNPNFDESGPMVKYRVAAMAKALDVTPEDLQNRLNSGATAWQIAREKGMTAEQFQQAMSNAHTEALKQAVTDGALTQEQADWMSTHMQGWENGFPRMGPGGRWNKNQP